LPADGLLAAATALLQDALAEGRAEVARRLEEAPNRGRSAAAATAFLHDQLLRLAFDLVTQRLYPNPNPTVSERIALVALGGSGRGEMAPYSDVDLMLLVSDRRAPWCEQVAEALLYLLWDLKLKIGQSMRTIDEVIGLSKGGEVVAGSARDYVTAKLAERDERHRKMGDSRYVVEPNVKDGKGGLRDLHTLYWIGQYAFGVERPADLVEKGLFTAAEFRRFERAVRSMSRCCSTTSPKAGAATIAYWARRSRSNYVHGLASMLARPRRWRGWCGTICCCRTPLSGATSPIPRRSTTSCARFKARNGSDCC
jgi:[protein-PII] uridylyltransferase